MKTYFDRPDSRAIGRVTAVLDKYMEVVPTQEEADLVILHVTGRNNHRIIEAQELLKQGKKYAVIQYALKSTRNPNPEDWFLLWKEAKVVWSYYDLSYYIGDFYHAPLASEPSIFYKQDEEKKYMVGTSGNIKSYKAECFGETHLAAYQENGKVAHVGKLNPNPIVDYSVDIDDNELRRVYNQCKRFACLRRKEGFEITAIESLLCGVRPVMFDTMDYRGWFDGFAEFIPECSVGDTVNNLRNLFKHEPQPVTDAEIEEVKRRFDWEHIVKGFVERCTN